jgi:hypothetical protein
MNIPPWTVWLMGVVLPAFVVLFIFDSWLARMENCFTGIIIGVTFSSLTPFLVLRARVPRSGQHGALFYILTNIYPALP